MRKLQVTFGLGMLGLIAGSAPGCMPEFVEVGMDEHGEGGVSGESGGTGAGAGGTSAGLGGTNRGGSSGSNGAGRAGSDAGRGGAAGEINRAGTGAVPGSGGRGGSTSGGDGGTGLNIGGDGGTSGITFGAHCDCYIVEELKDFVCTMSLEAFAQRVEIPTQCDNDETYLEIRSYDDGTISHAWQVGNENDYELVFNGDSLEHADTLEYGEAFGYVGELCDISWEDAHHGTITVGTANDAEISAECSVCIRPGVPIEEEICPACTPIADKEPFTVTEPLETYCSRWSCPATIEEARASLTSECPSEPVPPASYIRTGCGVIEVIEEYAGGLGHTRYVFDAESRLLVGASRGSDIPWGLCDAFEYRGGQVPNSVCPEAPELCYFCEPPVDGAGGVPGNEAYVTCPAP